MHQSLASDHWGLFINGSEDFIRRWERIKAFVFDWDGVFNDGHKNEHGGSSFSEVDSMGTNLLRLSYYLKHQAVPIMAVVSGEHNPLAVKFSSREFFRGLYGGVKNKIAALEHLCSAYSLEQEEVAFIFDDVLDFSMAKHCGLRVMICDESKPISIEYAKAAGLVDYITKREAGRGAVREFCELGLAINENAHDVFQIRTEFEDTYHTYLKARNAAATQFFKMDEQHNIVMK